jgi:hypothetical protein
LELGFKYSTATLRHTLAVRGLMPLDGAAVAGTGGSGGDLSWPTRGTQHAGTQEARGFSESRGREREKEPLMSHVFSGERTWGPRDDYHGFPNDDDDRRI